MSGEKSTFECVVSADLFRRAMLAVSTEETRYYLNGVHVSAAPDGGAVLVATDGSFLIAMYDPDAIVVGEGIVNLSKPLKAALKVSGVMLQQRLLAVRATLGSNDQKAFVVDVETKGADETYSPRQAAREVLDAPDRRVRAAQFGPVLIDGNFPNWRGVLPKKLLPGAAIAPLDQALLSRAAEALSVEKRRPVQLTSSGPNDPILVVSTASYGPRGFAIVMPIRHDKQAAVVPAWTKPVKGALAKAA